MELPPISVVIGVFAVAGSYFAVDRYRPLASMPMLLAMSAYSLHAADH
jgi:hypothetical protein